MSEKIYAERDIIGMDSKGGHYCRHISAMTREGLHRKSDIAAELGFRDMVIAELEAKCAALAAENGALKSAHPQPFGPEMMKALDAYERHQDEVPETGMLDAFFILRDSIRVKTPVTDCLNGEGVTIDENECSKAICAENAKLKEFISLECMVFGDNNNLLVAESFIPETPSTDAFLAEVRAQGVDSSIETLMIHLNHQYQPIASAIHFLKIHAAQLRQEAAQ